jgi:hypothetical protein
MGKKKKESPFRRIYDVVACTMCGAIRPTEADDDKPSAEERSSAERKPRVLPEICAQCGGLGRRGDELKPSESD